MSNKAIGLIGLGRMGLNLAKQFIEKNIDIVFFNRNLESETRALSENEIQVWNKTVTDLNEFLESLSKPRRILVMIPEGEGLDALLDQLSVLLNEEDIVVDLGNSFFENSQRRILKMKKSGIEYITCGVSGGVFAARNGMPIMASGSINAWNKLLEAGFKEVTLSNKMIGQGFAGHYVKMVHNAIEYSQMQVITDFYEIFKNHYQLTNDQSLKFFENYNLHCNTKLISITCEVLSRKENEPMHISKISDQCGFNGTGNWSLIEALRLKVPMPILSIAIQSRILSQREVSNLFIGQAGVSTLREKDKKLLNSLLSFCFICCFYEGLKLLKVADAHFKLSLNFKEILNVWKNGCIVETKAIDQIFNGENLLKERELSQQSEFIGLIERLQNLVSDVMKSGVSAPSLSAILHSINYKYSKRLPTAMIQAQRNVFGDHPIELIKD